MNGIWNSQKIEVEWKMEVEQILKTETDIENRNRYWKQVLETDTREMGTENRH